MNMPIEFDHYADTYDEELNRALSISGETKDYFATGRVGWLARCLARLREKVSAVLDYGCGTGDTSVLLREQLGAESFVGLDVSARSLELAAKRHGSNTCCFMTFSEYMPDGSIDLVYCNGVFHHIPVAKRRATVDYVERCLRPGGIFALWENNPWNPGTRYVMSRCAFDRDAITLSSGRAADLLRNCGFDVLKVDYQFFFPGFLRRLRSLEPRLSWFPLGAQYQLLARKTS